ncbi:hypothetical protein NDN08_003120 [Rhodosorus marinus]|uniref:CBM20 domain-containing protein n=1 Tax=Rhodosorus marinus TaxID=101924 RepID=A0AAV8V058_9RHOD|nr:hypothetical protein NDN08_003120 [Rhodosorus marinus]
MVQLRFAAFQHTLSGETLVVVGSDVSLGDWQPARAHPMVKQQDGYTHKCELTVYTDKDQVEYKYLLIDQNIPGHVKWENGMNRVIHLSDPGAHDRSDYSFEHGDSGWVPYEEGLEFLIVDDSEDEMGLSANDYENADQNMNGELANDGNTQETLTNETRGATENMTGPNSVVDDGGISHDKSDTGTEQGQGNHHSKENGRPFWMYWNREETTGKPPDRVESDSRLKQNAAGKEAAPDMFIQDEGSKVPLMNVAQGNEKVIRRASEVNLQDGQQLYRTRALPMWLLWRQENQNEASTSPGKSPQSRSPLTISPEPGVNLTNSEPVALPSEVRECKANEKRTSGRAPFWMLI